MKKSLSLASLAATVLMMASTALAQVPPPPGAAPGANESPATGQNDQAPLPQPTGRNTSVRHPDWRVGNALTDDWFTAMHGDIYYMQQHVQQLKSWAHNYNHQIYRHADWLNYLLTQYYEKHYDQHGRPRWYHYGRSTRGDFNYEYYYWLRPVYRRLLCHAAEYYREYRHRNGHAHKVREYRGYMREVVYKYHRLTKCNYGFNGDDNRAQDDSEVAAEEDDLGAEL
jgi:hypothetical protein